MKRPSPLFSLLALSACTSVLGIEELHQEPRDDSGGSPSSSSSSAGNSTGGTSQGGQSTGSGNHAGSGQAGSTSQTAGSGSGGSGATTSGGSAGAGDMPEPTPGPVHGTLIDFWGHPLSNVSMQVGTETVSTDRDGKFDSQSDVPAEYDVSLKLERESGGKVYGWVYQGLTRRDPTLQVYQGREDRDVYGYATITSQDTLGANDTISGAWGTLDGSYEKDDLDTSDNGNYINPRWQGGASNMGTAHLLLWSKNPATELPSGYKSYDSKLVAFEEGTDASLSFALKTMTIDSASVTGSVSPIGNGDRTNAVFLRFKSGATLTLADHTPSADAFSYLVPQLENASISVAASEVDGSDAFSVVHKDGLSPGDATGELVIPAPATINAPSGGTDTMVDATTPFSFHGSADSKGAYVVHVEADAFYQSLYIVTQKTTFTLPKVLGGSYALTPGRLYRWTVETHGAFATVDQLARAGGFLDAYSGPNPYSSTGTPAGAKQESGSYTSTGFAYFTFK
jgi:hypothetical protein